MQTPCKTLGGRMAHELFPWIPALLVMTSLGLGCGQQNEGTPSTPETPSAPEAAAEQPGGENSPKPESAGPNETKGTEMVANPETPKAPVAAGGADSLGGYLPPDSTMLFSANLKQLLDKGGHKEFLESDLFAQIMEEVDDELAIAILKDPAASGLDIARPAHVFMNVHPPTEEFGEPTVTGGLVMGVKDAGTLEATLNKIIAAAGMPLRVTEAQGYKQVAMEGVPVALGFTGGALVVVGTNDEERMRRVPAMLKARMKGDTKPSADLAKHLKKKYDVAAWFDYAQLMKMMGDLVGEEDPAAALLMDVYENLVYSATVRFDPGALVVDFGASFGGEDNKKFAGMAGKGTDAALLNMVPDDSIFAIGESVNMKAVRKMFTEDILPALEEFEEFEEIVESLEEGLGLTVDDLLSIPKGDVVLSWDSLEMAEGDFGPQPQVGFVLGITVENWKAAHKLINNPELQQGMAMLKGILGIQFAENRKALFLTSSKHADAVAEGTTENPIKGARRKLLADPVAGGFLRFDRLADVVENMAEGEEDIDKVVEVLRMFDEATFTSDMFSMEGKLTFRDKKTNSLKQIIDLSVELAEMAGEIGFGPEPEIDAAVEAEPLEFDPEPEPAEAP